MISTCSQSYFRKKNWKICFWIGFQSSKLKFSPSDEFKNSVFHWHFTSELFKFRGICATFHALLKLIPSSSQMGSSSNISVSSSWRLLLFFLWLLKFSNFWFETFSFYTFHGFYVFTFFTFFTFFYVFYVFFSRFYLMFSSFCTPLGSAQSDSAKMLFFTLISQFAVVPWEIYQNR